ncbi:MAG TPA: hypothetical protein VFQ61_12895 [Polyangiaceae bacterium]|nr:hypothetical protein [Polyangiaceae bacterium]
MAFRSLFLLLAGFPVLGSACVSDRKVSIIDETASGGATAEGGRSQGGRTSTNTNTNASGGDSSAQGGSAGAGGASCETGAARCNGNTPEHCEEGEWLPRAECEGDRPICQNGVCSNMRSSGHLSWQSPAPVTSGQPYRLLHHGISGDKALHAKVGGQWFTLRGALHP